MERHVQRLLNRVSCIAITIATSILLFLLLQIPETCVPPDAPSNSHLRFPKSTCDLSPRHYLPLPKKNARLWSSKSWMDRVQSLTAFFDRFRLAGLLSNHSRALCVSAGAGHAVLALTQMGVEDVTGVEVVESLPLVRRADPHNLPFFDGSFDFAFSEHLAGALYPGRYVKEMERTVRSGGACVIVVEECGSEEVKEIVGLFRSSMVLRLHNVTMDGKRRCFSLDCATRAFYSPAISSDFVSLLISGKRYPVVQMWQVVMNHELLCGTALSQFVLW